MRQASCELSNVPSVAVLGTPRLDRLEVERVRTSCGCPHEASRHERLAYARVGAPDEGGAHVQRARWVAAERETSLVVMISRRPTASPVFRPLLGYESYGTVE